MSELIGQVIIHIKIRGHGKLSITGSWQLWDSVIYHNMFKKSCFKYYWFLLGKCVLLIFPSRPLTMAFNIRFLSVTTSNGKTGTENVTGGERVK